MKNKQQIEKNMKRYPHLCNIKAGLSTLKTLKERLESRKKLIKANFTEKPPHEQNEIEITLIKTDIEIAKLNKNILERTEYFNTYFEQLANYFTILDKEFSNVRLEAIKLSMDKEFPKQKELKAELDPSKCLADQFNKNEEYRIRHYLELKKIMSKEPADNE